MNATPQQLAAFLAVEADRSFSEAARRLGTSQPALSRAIQMLEEALGTRLFDRDTRNVALTPAGAELKPLAERLTAEFDGAFGELAQFTAGRRGRVRVAALPSLAAMLLPAAVAALRMERPEVEVLVQDGLSDAVSDAVFEGRAEIGLVAQGRPNDRLAYAPLLADAFGLVCRDDDPLAARTTWPWSIFAASRFIAMAPSSSVRAMTDAAFLQLGLAITPLYECAFLGTTGHLVSAGLGITALPHLTFPLTAAPGLVWRPLGRPSLLRHIGMITRVGRSLSPAAEALIASIRAAADRMVRARQGQDTLRAL